MKNLDFSVKIPKTRLHYCAPLQNKRSKKRKKRSYEPEWVFNYFELNKLQVMKIEAQCDWPEEVVDNG